MESALETPRRISGLRRRGHLFKGLRTLANDPKATPAQRLEACKMLFELERNPDPRTVEQPAKLNADSTFALSLSALDSNNGQ
jgi:hypothetical protein